MMPISVRCYASHALVLSLLIIATCIKMCGCKENYVVDSLVVMDNERYKSWVSRSPPQTIQASMKSSREYMSFVIRQTNSRLAKLSGADNDWGVSLSVTEFIIGVSPLDGLANDGSVIADAALDALKAWATDNGYSTQFDYVILITGYDLKGSTSQGDNVAGIAYKGTLCDQDGTSVTVIEDNGDSEQTARLLAHEFGHSLGANHDGEPPNQACPDSDRFIMSIASSEVTSSNLLHPWYFSQCSKNTISAYFKQTILPNNQRCLKESKTVAPVYQSTSGKMAGVLYDVNEQCRMIHGQSSRICLGGSWGELGDVCTSLWCLDLTSDPEGFACSSQRAAEGTTCDNGKVCMMGECKKSPAARTDVPANPICLYGDSPVKINQQFSCQQYVSQRHANCYDPGIMSSCCKSCQAIATKSQACPYGNRQTVFCEDRNICDVIDPQGTNWKELCCETCGYDVIKTCVDVPLLDGMTCKQAVWGNHNRIQGCYNTTIAYHCCRTCQELRNTAVQGCEYGDYDLGCNSLVTDRSKCDVYKGQCCHTCRDPGSSAPNTRRLSLSVAFLSIVLMLLMFS